MAAADNRSGRGRLSSIDLLPDHAEEDITWALEKLRERKLPQTAILMEFNERLADKGIEPVSKSAFGRYAVRKAIQFRRLDEVQTIASELSASLDSSSADEVTVAVAELLKTTIFELLETGTPDSKGVMEMARALSSVVSAQRGSEEYRKQLERRVAEQVEAAADKAEVLVREAGLSPELADQLRREVLGLKPS